MTIRSALLLGATLCLSLPQTALARAPHAVFDAVDYRGEETAPLPDGQFRNPVIPGFAPDPSMVRVGDDFYLVNSSFAFFPGIPVYHSRDLVNWRQVGNAVERVGQFPMEDQGVQRGMFAPAITHHGGRFVIVSTCIDCGGNFIITADKAEGPWSDPIWLGFEGIDPSLFVDDDGRGWIVNNGSPAGPAEYDGHRAIWIQEIDLKSMKMIGPRQVLVNGGVDFSQKPIWIEGPHIFRKDGWYYMTAAEGGTAADHSQTIFRSRQVTGPYVPGPNNPILTQRDLPAGRADAVTATGHADLTELPGGGWAAVFLANRPYEGWLTNLGRETFLLPVTWRDGWPEFLPRGASVPLTAPRVMPADGTPPDWTQRSDSFDAPALGLDWLSLRTRDGSWHSIDPAAGTLTLTPQDGGLSDVATVAFVGLRQRHHRMRMTTTLRFQPERVGDRAGLAALADEAHHMFVGLEQMDGGAFVVVRARAATSDAKEGKLLARSATAVDPSQPLHLTIRSDGPVMDFTYRSGNGTDTLLLSGADARILATEYAGLLFTGTVIGPYAQRGPAITP